MSATPSAVPAGTPPADDRRRARWLLVALAVVLTAGEEAVLQGFAIQPGLALAPQLTAPGPFGVFHDLRWLMVFHASYGAFAGLVIALLVLRVALLTAFARLARPRGAPREPVGRAVTRSTAFVAVALVLLTPSATFLFADAIAPLWELFVAALVLGVVPMAVLAGAPFAGWWRLPGWRALGWAAVEAVVLMLAALAITVSPAWVTIVPAAAAGAANAGIWIALGDAMARRRVAVPARRPALGRAALGATAGVAAVGIAIGVQFIGAPSGEQQALAATRPGTRPVIFVNGFRSELEPGSEPLLGGAFRVRPFSYRGVGPGGRPLPYAPGDTYQSLAVSARKLARQVDALHTATGRPVALVGDSEGTLIAKVYLLSHPRAPVDELVMASPIVRPGRVVYPAPGDGGYGVATRFALRRLAGFVSAVAVPISVQTPLIRSIVDRANTLRTAMLCPIPGVRQEALLPLSDAFSEPPPVDASIPFAVLPTLHGDITQPGDFRRNVALSLSRHDLADTPAWKATARMIRGLAAAWQAPSLPLGLIGGPAPGPPARCAPVG